MIVQFLKTCESKEMKKRSIKDAENRLRTFTPAFAKTTQKVGGINASHILRKVVRNPKVQVVDAPKKTEQPPERKVRRKKSKNDSDSASKNSKGNSSRRSRSSPTSQSSKSSQSSEKRFQIRRLFGLIKA